MAPSAILPGTDTGIGTGIGIGIPHDASGRSGSKASSTQASVLHGPRDLRLETRPLSSPAPHELQIAIHTTGICGSDVSYYKHFRNGSLRVVEPLALGHEAAGVVVGIGAAVNGDVDGDVDVDDDADASPGGSEEGSGTESESEGSETGPRKWKLGDRVALEVGVPCDDVASCAACASGRYNLCPGMRFRSSAKSVPHFQGTLQERVNHPARWCYRIPPHVSFQSASLLEPLSVAIHATRRATLPQNATIIVFGAGTVGLLTAAMAKLSGATRILIADVDAGRVAYALSHGLATKGYVVARSPVRGDRDGEEGEGAGEEFRDARTMADEASLMLRDGVEGPYWGADVCFDCTGKEVCMQAGLFATKPGGKLVMVGMGTPVQTLPMSVSHLKEVDIVGIFRYANTYPVGLEIISEGLLLALGAMVTHRFKGLERAKEAFELAGRTVDDDGNLVLKVVIEA